MNKDWQADLERWLAPYMEALGKDATLNVPDLYCRPDRPR